MSSPLQRIRVRKYRGFRDETTLELRRVTLLFGWNNGGKSALARILPLVAESLGGSGPRALPPGFNLDSPVLRGAGFRQLVWSGPPDNENHVLEVELASAELQLHVAIGWSTDWRVPVIERFSATHGTSRLDAEWAPRRDERDSPMRSYDTGGAIVPLAFDGLLASSRSQLLAWLNSMNAALVEMMRNVSWLGSVRVGPTREFRVDVSPGYLHDDGSKADLLVFADDALLERVSSFYERLTGLALRRVTFDEHRAALSLGRGNFSVDFPDTGEGLQQLFAVIVGLEQLRDGAAGHLVVEEPDSHLHPEAQEQLAARVAEVVSANPNARVLLETHSEVLLTAIQAEVAAGRLTPADVACYWVEQDGDGVSRASLVELDDEGRFLGNEFLAGFHQLGDLRRRLLAERKGRHRAR